MHFRYDATEPGERYGGLPKNEAGYSAGSCVEAAGNLLVRCC